VTSSTNIMEKWQATGDVFPSSPQTTSFLYPSGPPCDAEGPHTAFSSLSGKWEVLNNEELRYFYGSRSSPSVVISSVRDFQKQWFPDFLIY
jgi:hypothetical protein